MTKRDIPLASSKQRQDFSLMAPKGVNLRKLSQLLDFNSAITMTNWLIDDSGNLFSREGQQKKHEVSSIAGFTMSGYFHDDVDIVGYLNSAGTFGVVSAIDRASDTEIVIKNTLAAAPTSGFRYGDFFFLVNGRQADKIHRVEKTLDYDAQTVNFTVGQIITQADTGATAKIIADNDSGTTGTLTLSFVDGIFENDKIIIDPLGGSATVNGILGYQATEITNGVKADVIHSFVASAGSLAGARIFLGGVGEDKHAVQWTKTDDGDDFPFDDVDDYTTSGTLPEDGGEILNKNSGQVNSISNDGDRVVTLYEEGQLSFNITQIQVASTATQDVVMVDEPESIGGKKGSKSTPFGVFYLANDGLHLRRGSKDKILTENLGVDYFKDVNFDNADIIHAPKERLIIATYGKDSTVNNQILWYNTQTGAVGLFSNWKINTFAEKDGDIFAGSAVNGKYYSLFDGFDDDGANIQSTFKQEINVAKLNAIRSANKFYMQSILIEDDIIEIDFDTIGIEGGSVTTALEKQIVGITPATSLVAWGTAGYGTGSWGSGSGAGTATSQVYQGDSVIPEFYRLFITIRGNSAKPKVINWFGIETDTIGEININNITDR